MSEQTTNLSLPYLLTAQAQKHVTHNDALRSLDALIQISVLDRNLTSPPAAPSEGTRFIVGAGATGDWHNHDGHIAAYQDGAWAFYTPREGWLAWLEAENSIVVFNGGVWENHVAELDLNSLSDGTVTRLGVNATADDTNRLFVNSNALLFNNVGAGVQAKINKNAAGDSASLLFQTGFSGRAELGTTGDDDFHVKVSPDGSSFFEAIVIDHSDGSVSFPNSGYADNSVFNLYSDSGRLSFFKGITIGSFNAPTYIQYSNSSTVAAVGKFIHNNSDYGGTAGTMVATVKDLVDKIRHSSYRRYGPEFWVAEVTKGDGTGAPISSNDTPGVTYTECLFNAQKPRLPKMTFGAYFRAVDDDICFRRYNGQTIYLDGVARSSNCVISPSDGWVCVRIRDSQDPRSNFGYTPATINVYCKASGDRVQFTCPVLVPGLVDINKDIGIVANQNIWS